MKKNTLEIFAFITLLLLSACAQTQDWDGSYTYDAFLDENAAEDKIIIEYIFTLEKNKCLISSQGYQTDEKILCTAEKNKENLVVKFLSYEDGSTKNAYDVEVYAPKSILLTLTNKGSSLTTTWGALAPDKSFSTGEYFTKK